MSKPQKSLSKGPSRAAPRIRKCNACGGRLTPLRSTASSAQFRCLDCGAKFQFKHPPVQGADPDPDRENRDQMVRRFWEHTIQGAENPSLSIRPEPGLPGPAVDAPKTSFNTASLPQVAVAPASGAASAGETPLQILNKLNEGGMGVIFRARQESLHREVALKQMRGGALGQSEAGVEQFLSEAFATGMLDHPNIVPVHELGRDQKGAVFYTMKLIQGRPWKDYLYGNADDLKTGPRTMQEHLEVLLKVCDAIAFAHSRGIIHRDLKPENVMVGAFGEVLVVDWGLAATVRREGEAQALLPYAKSIASPGGTPHYMPPEMALGLGDQIGAASDVYLLGAILFEVLFRRTPHHGESIWLVLSAAANNEIQFPAMMGSEIRAYYQVFSQTLNRALATKPEFRQGNASVFAAELREDLKHYEAVRMAATANETLRELTVRRSSKAGKTGPEDVGKSDYFQYAEVIAGLKQALASWPDNRLAQEWLHEAHTAYAQAALAAGDLRLAEAQAAEAKQVSGEDPGHDHTAMNSGTPSLQQEIGKAKRAQEEQAAKAKRLKGIQWAATVAMGALVLVITVALVLVNGERSAADQARNEAEVQNVEALRQKHAAEVAQAEAEKQKGRAVEAQASIQNALHATQEESYAGNIQLANSYLASQNFLQIDTCLERCLPEFRNWEWGWTKSLSHPEIAYAYSHYAPRYLEISQGGRWVLSRSKEEQLVLSTKDLSLKLKLRMELKEVIQCTLTDDYIGIVEYDNGYHFSIIRISDGLEVHKQKSGSLPHIVLGKSMFAVCERDAVLYKYGNQVPSFTLNGNPSQFIAGAWFSDDNSDLWTMDSNQVFVRWQTDSGEKLETMRLSGAVPLGSYSFGVVPRAFCFRHARKVDGTSSNADIYLFHNGKPMCRSISCPDGDISYGRVCAGKNIVACMVYANNNRDKVPLQRLMVYDLQVDSPPLLLESVTQDEDAIRSYSLNDAGTRIAVAKKSGKSLIYDIGDLRANPKLITVLAGHSGYVNAIAYLTGSSRVVTTGYDGSTRLWETEESNGMERLLAGPDGFKFSDGGYLTNRNLCLDGDTGIIAVKRESNQVVRLSLKTKPDPEAELIKGHVGCLAANERSICYNIGPSLYANDRLLGSSKEVGEGEKGSGGISCVEIGPSGTRIAIGRDNGTVDVYSATWEHQARFSNASNNKVLTLTFDANGNRLIAGYHGPAPNLIVWDLVEKKMYKELSEHGGWDAGCGVPASKLRPGAKQFATVGYDSTVRLWDNMDSLHSMFVMSGHFWNATDCAFSPDGTRLASVSSDRTLKIWDTNNGRELLTIPLRGIGLQCLWTKDGKSIITYEGDVGVVMRTPRYAWKAP